VSGPYGGGHQRIRKAVLPFAYGQLCHFCHEPMLPGQQLDLDHLPGTDLYRGPCHSSCNRADGARRGNAARRQRRRRIMDKATAVVLGIEVSEDRQHTSVCAAGRLEGDLLLIELAAYLLGTAGAVERVVELHGRWTVLAVVVDPMGGATTLRRPLGERPGVHLVEPATADVKVAHGEFLDLFQAKRIRHTRQAELTAAVQHLSERQLGGQPVFDRRGAPVDVSPAVAAELAVWGLLNIKPPPRPFALVGR
jgi:hypothetical protein